MNLTATPATAWSVYSAASDGDVVLLAAGSYGQWSLNPAKVGITLQAADGARVTFTGIRADRTQRITLRGLEIATADNGQGVSASGAVGLTLDGLDIHGPAGSRNGIGVNLRDTSGVTLTRSKIHDTGAGVVHLNADRTVIEANDIRDIRGDAITGASGNVTVRANTITNLYPQPGDHPDAIQFWGLASGPAPGLVIEGNVYTRGQGGAAQGIFIERASDVVIRANAMIGPMYNGISVSAVTGAKIDDNLVVGFPDMGTRIITRDASSGVSVTNNVAQQVTQYAGPNPGYIETGNSIIAAIQPSDTATLANWLKRKDDPRVTALEAALRAMTAERDALSARVQAARAALA